MKIYSLIVMVLTAVMLGVKELGNSNMIFGGQELFSTLIMKVTARTFIGACFLVNHE
jgi:hypothetical protein